MKVGDGMKHFMPLLDHWELDSQQGRFKMVVKIDPKASMLPPFDSLVDNNEC